MRDRRKNSDAGLHARKYLADKIGSPAYQSEDRGQTMDG
jgi:hypothetical protein